MLDSITPCFIVDDLRTTIEFYASRLGFKVLHKGGGEKEADDFWAFMNRDQVMISFKAITQDIHPQPNSSRHEWANGTRISSPAIRMRSTKNFLEGMFPYTGNLRILRMD